ncbi:STAS domain-containing protein [Actinocorallia populi]|uniref:STAS domain-containing protein n=1 Tax=Actinocorallia populi TaxID=2079200 RepID=UPI001300273B|nr:STAS domain-containing protein [Actinocorallia populi]
MLRRSRSEPMRTGPIRCPEAADERDLRVELAALHGDTAVVTVAGEIDLRSALTLRDHLLAVTEAGFESIVIDFEQVLFCDASGLNALVALANRVRARGGGVWLAGVRPPQRRLFQITGLDRRFPLCERVEDAVAQAGPHPLGR